MRFDRHRHSIFGLIAFLIVFFAAAPLKAQQAPATPPPSSSTDQQSDSPKPESKADQQATNSQLPEKPEPKSQVTNDRIMFVMPNYLTVENAKEAPKLSPGEKFKLATLGTFDWFVYPFIAGQAAIAQAQNSPKEYGQGWGAYGKRYGQAFGDNGIGNYMTSAIFPSLLHQDPRYYQLGHGGVWHRTFYAVSRMFVTRGDSGNAEFNCSEICGNAVNAAISRTYHVDSERNAGDAAATWWTQIGWDAASNVSKEFWPDIHRWLRKKKSE